MPSTSFPFNPPRKGKPAHRAGRPVRQGQVMMQQPGLSRMALEQPDDTPYDQRRWHAQLGPRQMA